MHYDALASIEQRKKWAEYSLELQSTEQNIRALYI